MQTLNLTQRVDGPLTMLCLGAHADDIEIGAGGTIITLLDRYPGTHVHWVVFSATSERADEARCSAGEFLGAAGRRVVTLHKFRDGFFPGEWSNVKEVFENLRALCEPDLIFTHHRSDHHQDHRIIAELTWNTYRDHLVLEYEIPKYDPDMANPNLFVPLQPGHAETKVRALMSHYPSQRQRRWFTPDAFYALMHLRGIQAAAPSGLAEGFYASKLCI
jgi:LmbE family N-acetylglucosaminyl deacetylase